MGCPRCKLQTDDLFAEIDRDLSQTLPGPSQTNILTTLWKGGQFRLCFHNNDKANFAPDDEHALNSSLNYLNMNFLFMILFPFERSCWSKWMNRIHGFKYRALSNLAERYLGRQWPFGLNLQIVLHIWFMAIYIWFMVIYTSWFKRHWKRHRRHRQKIQNKIFLVWVSRLEMSFKLVFLL